MKRRICGILLLTIAALLAACAPEPVPGSEGYSVATVCAVGDIYLTDDMLADAKKSGEEYDFTAQLSGIVPALASADLTIGNFEGNFAAAPYSQAGASYPDALADALAVAGVDILQTANTCSIQNGISGMERTKAVIEAAGMTALGTYLNAEDRTENQVVLREVNGIRIAFVAFTKGLGGMGLPDNAASCVNLLFSDYTTNYSKIDTSGIVSVLEQAQRYDPDVIIAALHWGSEGISEVSATQERIAELMIQNGVDVILGTHSHRASELSRRTATVNGVQKDVVIAYGLGDFNAAAAGECNLSVMLNLEFTRDNATGEITISEVAHHPVAAVDRGEEATNRFVVLDADNAVALYESNYVERVSTENYESILKKRESLEKTLFPPEE